MIRPFNGLKVNIWQKMKYFNVLLALFIGFGDMGCQPEKVTAKLPNIVWLISEDNSPFLGCYGDSLAVTPNLDKLAGEGVLFENAFANAPVCAPARSTLITGMYATSLGTQHMRCLNPVPGFVHFFPYYLKEAGYFTTNRKKTDYNTFLQEGVWDNDWWDWKDAFKGRQPDQPFFMMYNTWMSHEDKIHSDQAAIEYYKVTLEALYGRNFTDEEIDKRLEKFRFKAGDIPIPPYQPPTFDMKNDWARYYNRVQMMDEEMGIVMELLKKEGLWDNTIVFYFSDHGGVLPRSKRFIFESGLKVPMILHFPEKYRNMAPAGEGSRLKDVVSFIDLAPTVLSLAGIQPPDYMEGKAFLGDYAENDHELAFAFRGRMDERYDKVRSVRDKQYRYRINFMPQRIYGQHINFLWKAPSMQSWEKAFDEGECNPTQSRFFEPKAVEELYDVSKDPYCVINLAEKPDNKELVGKYRNLVLDQMRRTRDTGVLPEALMMELMGDGTAYDYMLARQDDYEDLLQAALVASRGDISDLEQMEAMMDHDDPAIRYWGATGCPILKDEAGSKKNILIDLATNDSAQTVRIAAAEALFYMKEKDLSLKILGSILSKNLQIVLEKEKTIKRGYVPEEFVLTHALNVITTFGQDGYKLKDEIAEIASKDKSEYARGAASYLLKKME